MFRSLFTHKPYAGFPFTGRTARRAAMTVLTLGALSGAALAQTGIFDGTWTYQPVAPVSTPLRAYFTGLTCHKVSNDNTWPRSDRDEPYVVIFSADLRGTGSSTVIVSQEFSDVNTGTTKNDWHQFWSVAGYGSPIGSSNDYIFLAALMECDTSANRTAVRNRVANTLIPKLVAYKQGGMSRVAMVSNLMTDMDGAIEASRRTTGDEDDRVGGIQEVLFSAADLESARAGQGREQARTFVGSDSRYTVRFRVNPEPIIR
jgi:hypothetical protein